MTDESFEQVWEANRDQVFRSLLGLTRDVELAEDCLQDTYLRARSGLSGYRGGSPMAWFSVIAKNVFFGHARRKGFRWEESLETVAEQADSSPRIGSDTHFDLMVVHDAVSALAPDLRKALIMKHYGDWDYDEIGRHLSCTPAMAKHRVWRAMQKIRASISAEQGGIGCSAFKGPRILDWLYGALSPRRLAEVEAHAKLCVPCRRNLSEVTRLASALEDADQDWRIHTLIDIDEHGRTARYVWVKLINATQDVMHKFRWNRRPGWTVEYLALQGQTAAFRLIGASQSYPDLEGFEGDLSTPVMPGQMVEGVFVVRTPAGSHWNAQPLDGRMWHYHHKHTPFPDNEGLFVVTIRLPEGARLLNANPVPRASATRAGRLSLTWQIVTEIVGFVPDERASQLPDTIWQFQAHLDYVLDPKL